VRSSWLAFVALVACYAPNAAPGAPCGSGDRCPTGLDCVDSVCVEPGTQPADAPAGDGLQPDAGDPPASCTNGVRDGTELDIDCGGGCPACANVFATDGDTLAIFELDGDVMDTSGNNRHGTFMGGTYEASAWGRALRLEEMDPQGFEWPFASTLVHPYTIEIVMTPYSLSCYRKIFGVHDANDFGWYYCDGFVDHPNSVIMSAGLTAGVRHYFAFVSTAPTTVDVYFQGTRIGSTNTSFIAPPPGAIFFRDDSSGGSPRSERFDGIVEAMRISSTTRTQAQITALQARLAAQP
jgi:hypothetical protein